MKQSNLPSARACAAAVASLLSVPAVFAQDAPPAGKDAAAGVEEITVTARRRDESLQDVPIAMSAFSAERLDDTGALDVTWLQQTTPNLTLQVARGTNSTLIAFIRGVGQQDPLWGFEPGVGLYVDDVYIARPQGAVLDIYDIERLEVLRGPQGTLYGRNTVGGAIKYVTKPLGEEPRLDVRANLGSYDQTDLIASGSTPIGETFAVGASAAVYRRDGYGENLLTGEEHYDKDVNAFRVSAEWNPSDTLGVRFAADYVDDNSNAKHGHREAPGAGLTAADVVPVDVYDTTAGIGGDNNVETRGVSLTAAWDITDVLTFKSITAYREGETQTLIDFDSGPTPALDIPGRYEDDQTTQEFQLLFEGERVQGVAGLYYLDATAAGAFDTPVGALVFTIATSGEVKTESYAAFADVSFDLTDALSASLGVRWTHDERQGTVYRQNFTGLGSPLFGVTTGLPGLVRSDYTNERTFEELTPRASLSYEFSDDLTAYAAYSEGFKSGGFDMRGDAVLTPDTVNGYDPEYVDSYELGLKGDVLDGRLSFNGAVFYADYTGQQITRQEPTVTGVVASFVDNAGSSTIQGVELEGAIAFTERLTATYGIGYVDAEFDEFHSVTVVSGVPVPIDLSDTAVFQNTPEWNGNLTLSYRHELANGSDLTGTVSGSYRSEYSMFEFENPLLDQTESYTLLDANLVWALADGRTRFALHGRNLTDEEYKIGGYYFPGAAFGNIVNSFYGPPRTWFVSASYSFH
jgi:iron complex outermembrane receptor protein